MKKIKINFCGFWGSFKKDDNLFTRMLSKYFDVEVTSTHIDDCDYIGVWICYKEKEEN